jgi:hypothetical protein
MRHTYVRRKRAAQTIDLVAARTTALAPLFPSA